MTLRHRCKSGFILLLAASWTCAETPTQQAGGLGPGAPTSPTAPMPDPTAPEEFPIGLRVAPDASAIDPGETIEMQAVLIAEDLTESLTDDVIWSSTDPDVASVSADGLVLGIGGGIAYVIGRSGELTDSARIVVRLYLSQISVGEMHTCGLDSNGAAYCWGGNAHGELGTGDYVARAMPARSARTHDMSMIAAAGGFTCGVTTSGVGYCWGDNKMMELGETQAGKSSSVPVPISGGLTFRLTSGSQMAHACGLESNGKAWCWGYNRFGMVGHGILRDEPVPVAVAGELSFVDLHSSYFRTCGVDTSGDIYCWGRGGPTQIGDPSAATETCGGLDCALSPMRATRPEAFSHVSVSSMHSCALTENADDYCWGSNESGQLGLGGYSDRDAPTKVSLPGSVTMVATGRVHSCALLTDGRAYCWGDNTQGQLGTADWSSSDMPQQVAGGLTFASLAAGYHQTCAIDLGGEAYCWGRNKERQLGVGEGVSYGEPTLIQFE